MLAGSVVPGTQTQGSTAQSQASQLAQLFFACKSTAYLFVPDLCNGPPWLLNADRGQMVLQLHVALSTGFPVPSALTNMPSRGPITHSIGHV